MANDITNIFNATGIKAKRPIKVESNEFSYIVKENPHDNWNFFAFHAFREISNSRSKLNLPVKSFATIGSGNGVDALGAFYVFPKLESIFITDINSKVLGICEKNFSANLPKKKKAFRYDVLEGNLCEPLIEKGIKADVIYANIPNIPDDAENIFVGRNSSGFFDKAVHLAAPEEFQRYLMSLQYSFLMSAKKALAKDGVVVMNFGGRVPYKLIPKMFDSCGYNFKEICCGFKKQTEGEEMFPAYSKGEREYGVAFDFYLHDESLKLMDSMKISNPGAKISGEKLKEILAPFKITATEGLELFSKGKKIGHTVHLLSGSLK